MKNVIKATVGFFILLGIILTAASCRKGGVKSSLLPGIAGKAGEVVIIIEPGPWNGSMGQAFRDLLTQPVPALPQREPMFNPVDVPHKAFSNLFKQHRNIIITNIDPQLSSPKFAVSNDAWASPQTIITIEAPSVELFMELFNQNRDNLLGTLLKAERDRIMTNYLTYAETPVIRKLEMISGINLTVPKGYSIDMDTTNFVWLTYETPDVNQGIFVYQYPYTDDSTFTLNYLINKRNEVLKQCVHGAIEGSYMTTENQIEPIFRSYMWKNEYTAEVRGLWKLENGFMGGPFVSLTRVDKAKNRIVTVEGYVFAPKFDKRNYLRQVEAILYSFTWPTPATTQKK